MDEMLQKIGTLSGARVNRKTRWAGVIVVVGVLAGGNYAWWYHQPITPEQRLTLTALVAKVADKSGQSTRAVWERLKKEQGVRRIEDFRRGSYDYLASNLNQGM